MTNSQLTAIILAGGRGVRMGGPKTELQVGGRRLIDRAVELCGAVLPRVLVIRGTQPRIPRLQVPQLPDAWPDHGALGGIHTGLKACPGAGALVLACDMPLMESEFLAFLSSHAGDGDVVVPRSRSGLQPLCAIYHSTCLPAVERALRAGMRQILAVYPAVQTQELALDQYPQWADREDLFTNLNTPADLARIQTRPPGDV